MSALDVAPPTVGSARHLRACLPEWARWLVVFSPLWHAVELCRAATTGHGSWTDLGHVAVLLACIAAGAWWGHRTFTRRLSA